jgi:5'-3' exoribonuclease 1
MAVLPPASRELVPLAFRDLMCDVNSPLLHFYPPTFEQDLDGRKHAWEAVVKIPFIDEKRLLEVMAGESISSLFWGFNLTVVEVASTD